MTAPRLALVGAPNSGKSTLFNGLTGRRSKVANYPGATVDILVGRFTTPAGQEIELVDVPGIYGFNAQSTDEKIALDLLQGQLDSQAAPNALIVVVEAANLRTHLHSVLQMKSLGLPMLVVLNMIDLATRDGLEIDVEALETHLGMPVVTACSTRKAGREAFLARLDQEMEHWGEATHASAPDHDLQTLQEMARDIADKVLVHEPAMNLVTRKIDHYVLHPVAGPAILLGVLFVLFQAVFTLATPFMGAIESGAAWLGGAAGQLLPAGWIHDLVVDGVIAGVGSVLVFLPQIAFLFAFILTLEGSGYMARAAVLMDELMLRVGLNGRAFIPLLSSFACAVPGIMAARTINSERDRLITILVAPLMTCSARLPVYTLIIAAFIPPTRIGLFNLQGLVMFGLYIAGIVSAVLVAFVLKTIVKSGHTQQLIMELPVYKLPGLRDSLINLWVRLSAFIKRAGSVILMTSIALWFLANFPSSAPSLRESYAGQAGALLEKILAPIGFNLEISIALVPGMAAREVAVGALGTVYAIQGGEDNVGGLAAALQSAWSLPTALAFLAWYVFAPQCFATLATARRETNSRAWTGFMFGYLFVLAYIAAGATFHIASALGL